MASVDRGTELIEDAPSDDQVRERLLDCRAIHRTRRPVFERVHVPPVLLERDGGETHVMTLLQEQHGTRAAGVSDPVQVRRRAKRTAGDRDVVVLLQRVDDGLYREKRKAHAPGEFAAAQLACEMQCL